MINEHEQGYTHRTFTYNLTKWPVDDVLQKRIQIWADRRQFHIEWKFKTRRHVGDPGKEWHFLEVTFPQDCPLNELARTEGNLVGILQRWNREKAKSHASNSKTSASSSGRLVVIESMVRDAVEVLKKYRHEVDNMPAHGDDYNYLGTLWMNVSSLVKAADSLEKTVSRQLDKSRILHVSKNQ